MRLQNAANFAKITTTCYVIFLLATVFFSDAQAAVGIGAPHPGASSLPADAPKSVNIVPPEAAHNASTVVVGDTAADRGNASLLAEATADNTAVRLQTDDDAQKTSSVLTSGDVVTIQHGEQSRPFEAVSTGFSENKQIATALIPGLNSSETPWIINHRLPAGTVPEHYDIVLRPDLESGNFSGSVTIIFKLTFPTKFIQLNSKGLDVFDVKLSQLSPTASNSTLDAVNLDIDQHFFYAKNEFLIIKPVEKAQPDRYALRMRFNGTMLGKINGLYRSTYKGPNNETKYMAVTQMETTYARQAFPCFDEPIYKSTFNISIMHAPELIALSNMRVLKRTTLDSNTALTRFEKSPPMSTYLAAFIVCDFEYIETNSTSGNVRLRAYGTAEQIAKGNLKWALEVLKYSVAVFEDYFEIPFQLPKLDIIGIPDFLYGAMENWGCITFREVNILFDALEASAGAQQNVAITVAHEVAHQWFGDLVTPAWWDSLWLNEGFAMRMEFYGITGLQKGSSSQDWFVASQMQKALSFDSLASSHPIDIPALTDPDDIAATFDDIPYSKGASVLLMLENFLGPESFRRGIVRFLKKHRYSAATADELWLALTEQLAESCTFLNSSLEKVVSTNAYGAGSQCIDVKQVMDTWLLQMNYPLLTLKALNATHGQVRQDRFLLNDDHVQANTSIQYPSPYNFTWRVPIAVRELQNDHQSLVWANHSTAVIEWSAKPLDSADASETTVPAVLLNVGQTGFYRVNYPLSLWMTLSDRLAANITAIPDARERSGLISDAFSLAHANLLPYSVPFSLFRFLRQERSLAVWQTASDAFEFLGDRLQAVPEAYYLFRELMRRTVRPVLTDLGWKDEGTSTERRLRELAMYISCQNGDPTCLRNVQKLFRGWLYDGKRVPPDFRSSVYKFGMLYTDNDQPWELTLQKLTASKTPQEIKLLLTALASSSHPWQIERLLYLAWNETYVRLQDIVFAYEVIADNPAALPYVWNYYRNNLPRLVEKRTLNDAYLGRLPLSFASEFNDQLQLAEMKALFEKYPEAGAGRLSRKQAIETIENSIAWLQRHNATVTQWLKQQQLCN